MNREFDKTENLEYVCIRILFSLEEQKNTDWQDFDKYYGLDKNDAVV